MFDSELGFGTTVVCPRVMRRNLPLYKITFCISILKPLAQAAAPMRASKSF
jgi:hypothetical protein